MHEGMAGGGGGRGGGERLFERYDIVETCNSLRDACKW